MKQFQKDKFSLEKQKVNQWKEKANHQKELSEFMEWKELTEKEQKEYDKMLEDDYEHIENQL